MYKIYTLNSEQSKQIFTIPFFFLNQICFITNVLKKKTWQMRENKTGCFIRSKALLELLYHNVHSLPQRSVHVLKKIGFIAAFLDLFCHKYLSCRLTCTLVSFILYAMEKKTVRVHGFFFFHLYSHCHPIHSETSIMCPFLVRHV